MIKYGVSHPLATWPMTVGCSSRTLAGRLTAGYVEDKVGDATLRGFVDWFASLTEENFIYRFKASSHEARALSLRARSVVPNRRQVVEAIRRPPEIFSSSIAGVEYEGREMHTLELDVGASVELRRDFDNQYDANAVSVYFRGNQIGFLERNVARMVAPDLDCGMSYEARVDRVERARRTSVGLVLRRAS